MADILLAHHNGGWQQFFYSLGYVTAAALVFGFIAWSFIKAVKDYRYRRPETPDDVVRCGFCGADAWIEHPSANYGPPLGDEPIRWECGLCGHFSDEVKR